MSDFSARHPVRVEAGLEAIQDGNNGLEIRPMQAIEQRQVFLVKAQNYQLLRCPADFSTEFTDNIREDYFYHESNEPLYPPSTLDNFWLIEQFSNIAGRLENPRLFFEHLVTPVTAREVRGVCERGRNLTALSISIMANSPESYCERICPAGFEVNSYSGDSSMLFKDEACLELTKMHFDPRVNASFQLSACVPCGEGTYRYAFPLSLSVVNTMRNIIGFQTCYECTTHRQCNDPYQLEYNGTTTYDAVCNCQDGDLRIVTVPFEVIDQKLEETDGEYALENTTNLTARYFDITESFSQNRSYDFLCVAAGQYCFFNDSNGENPGYQYAVNGALTDCFFLNNDNGTENQTVATALFSFTGSSTNDSALFLQSASFQPVTGVTGSVTEHDSGGGSVFSWLWPAVGGGGGILALGVVIGIPVCIISYFKFRAKGGVYRIGGPEPNIMELTKRPWSTQF